LNITFIGFLVVVGVPVVVEVVVVEHDGKTCDPFVTDSHPSTPSV
jgi:hypothetical protein